MVELGVNPRATPTRRSPFLGHPDTLRILALAEEWLGPA
jgi:hypothetical protein